MNDGEGENALRRLETAVQQRPSNVWRAFVIAQAVQQVARRRRQTTRQLSIAK